MIAMVFFLSVTEPLSAPPTSGDAQDVRNEVPNYAYAYTAHGAPAKTVGAAAYGLGVAARRQRGILGGGLTLWGSPIDRITIIGDAQRNVFGDFVPSLAVTARILGSATSDGWSLGALGKFKMEGFGGQSSGAGTPAKNPGEIEGEVEVGLLVSYRTAGGLHVDLNAVTGMGTGDDGEVDSEGRLRIGWDLTRVLRVGLDGQARVRLSGPRYLPNGKTWDFAAGPQAILGWSNFFVAGTAGPATTGLLSDRVGWNATVTVGASTF